MSPEVTIPAAPMVEIHTERIRAAAMRNKKTREYSKSTSILRKRKGLGAVRLQTQSPRYRLLDSRRLIVSSQAASRHFYRGREAKLGRPDLGGASGMVSGKCGWHGLIEKRVAWLDPRLEAG